MKLGVRMGMVFFQLQGVCCRLNCPCNFAVIPELNCNRVPDHCLENACQSEGLIALALSFLGCAHLAPKVTCGQENSLWLGDRVTNILHFSYFQAVSLWPEVAISYIDLI
jgi:hypothetical protein